MGQIANCLAQNALLLLLACCVLFWQIISFCIFSGATCRNTETCLANGPLAKHGSNFVENEHGQYKHQYLKRLHDNRWNVIGLSKLFIEVLITVVLADAFLRASILDNSAGDNDKIYCERNIPDHALFFKTSIQEAQSRVYQRLWSTLLLLVPWLRYDIWTLLSQAIVWKSEHFLED